MKLPSLSLFVVHGAVGLALAGAWWQPTAFAAASSVNGAASGSAAKARFDPEGALAANDTCEGCHASESRDWQASLHKQAASDPSFKVAVGFEPLAFCRGCHAPSSDPNFATPAAGEALGVGCIHCHESAGPKPAATGKSAAILGDEAGAATPNGAPSSAPHGPLRTKACASCHQFAFPDDAKRLMQSTQDEHGRSGFASVTCEGCHMPKKSDGHTDHGFVVSKNEAMLKSATTIEVARAGGTRVAVRITPKSAGHAFPTGDLFRRLEVAVAAVDEGGAKVAARRRFLGRHFAQKLMPNGTIARVDVRDDRPGAKDGETCFELDLGPRAAGQELRAEIFYERVDHPRSADEADAIVSQHTSIFAQALGRDAKENPCAR